MRRLAAEAGWPLLADAASGLRTGDPEGAVIVTTGHHLATSGGFWQRHRPEVIIRVGHPTAGRALREALAAWRAETWLVDPLDRWEEPTGVPEGRWRSPIGALARGVTAGSAADSADSARSAAWAAAWREAEAAAVRAIGVALGSGPLLEAGVARTLGEVLGPADTVYASNSMPVRDLDAFLAADPRTPRVVAHRGTNGIDGVVSAAAGLAAGLAGSGPGRVVLLAGDLALLHDIGGLLGAAGCGVDLTIVVPNNGGGGIFSFLPVASAIPPSLFERYFTTPQQIDLGAALAGLGVAHRQVTHRAGLAEAVEAANRSDGLTVIEVPVNVTENVAQHRLVERAVGGR